MKIEMEFDFSDEVPKIYIDGEQLCVSAYSKAYGVSGFAFSVDANYPIKESSVSTPFPVSGLSFGIAIDRAKKGHKIQRAGWNGNGQYVQLATCISYTDPAGAVVNAEHKAIGNQALAFVGTSGVQLGWLASQADMLADDWRIIG